MPGNIYGAIQIIRDTLGGGVQESVTEWHKAWGGLAIVSPDISPKISLISFLNAASETLVWVSCEPWDTWSFRPLESIPSTFYARNFCAKVLFWQKHIYRKALMFFGAKILYKNACIKRWWNWLRNRTIEQYLMFHKRNLTLCLRYLKLVIVANSN
jgi:hypothetical protein